MKNYKLTIEDGLITHIDNVDATGAVIPGVLEIPKEVTGFASDAWVHLGCEAQGICVHPQNPVFSSAHHCLMSKNGKKLIKTCQSSDVSGLSGLRVIGPDAFQTPWEEREQFLFRIPEGVEVLDYRAFALSADRVEIIVPASVAFVNLMAFMIHSKQTHIIFEGDPQLQIGAFGTAAEAVDSGNELYRSLPAVVYPKAEHLTVTCKPNSKISAYCQKYGIREVQK